MLLFGCVFQIYSRSCLLFLVSRQDIHKYINSLTFRPLWKDLRWVDWMFFQSQMLHLFLIMVVVHVKPDDCKQLEFNCTDQYVQKVKFHKVEEFILFKKWKWEYVLVTGHKLRKYFRQFLLKYETIKRGGMLQTIILLCRLSEAWLQHRP